ncbi:hypothetical protein PAPYR_4581 [Paratrimastix pyriformis]|uniref:Uncharacterized protein n=1 Tax=Paratrimastix pyriformis TaxID=342808 RepID=A0ABQ8UJW2_9EUKA|nr:hypothetical protein PAPYR_4581 [Paratrimastix pyriformis]
MDPEIELGTPTSENQHLIQLSSLILFLSLSIACSGRDRCVLLLSDSEYAVGALCRATCLTQSQQEVLRLRDELELDVGQASTATHRTLVRGSSQPDRSASRRAGMRKAAVGGRGPSWQPDALLFSTNSADGDDGRGPRGEGISSWSTVRLQGIRVSEMGLHPLCFFASILYNTLKILEKNYHKTTNAELIDANPAHRAPTRLYLLPQVSTCSQPRILLPLLPTPGWRFPAHFPSTSMQPGPRPGDRVPLPQQPRRLPTSSDGDRESVAFESAGVAHGLLALIHSAAVLLADIIFAHVRPGPQPAPVLPPCHNLVHLSDDLFLVGGAL